MQLYDLIFLALVAVLGFVGVMRGGIRSLIDVVAFFFAIFMSAVSIGFLRRTFHLDVLTGYIGAVVVFIVVMVVVRYLGHVLSDKIHKQRALGTFDRVLGGGLGILMALLILGVFHLLFSAVTPIDRQPEWFRAAKVYPLSARSAKTIQALLPKSTGLADKVAPQVES